MDLKDCKFTKEHEWVYVEDENATIGISDYAQKELGDVVFVELPAVGESFSKGDPCSNIESVKAVSDIYAPVGGEIVEVNSDLEYKPELINQEPYAGGWIFKMRLENPDELDELMTAAEYEKYLEGIQGE